MTLSRLLLAGLSAIAVPFVASAGPVYYLVTAQSGANTTIDADHLTQWYPSTLAQSCIVQACANVTVADFAPTFDWQLGGGNFTIKRGDTNQDSIILNIWDGVVSGTPAALTGTNVATVTLAAASVATQYTPTDFLFTTPVTLLTGHKYIATLTSVASTNGADQYFIKDPQVLQIQDSGGVVLTDTVPEPATWVLMAGFFGLAGLARRKGFRFSN